MSGSSREIKKTNAARRLDELGVPYELLHFDVSEDDLSAERAAADVGLPFELVYKTLVLRGDKTGVMEACIPAGMELDVKALAALSGNKSAAMVHVKELRGLTGYERGGCSPIGSRRYPVYIHSDALNHDKISVNAGSRGLLFLMSPHDLVKVTDATSGEIAR
jgi:Cys-tRNA(Pro)/Cys-tRNA(Cys) deacylase